MDRDCGKHNGLIPELVPDPLVGGSDRPFLDHQLWDFKRPTPESVPDQLVGTQASCDSSRAFQPQGCELVRLNSQGLGHLSIIQPSLELIPLESYDQFQLLSLSPLIKLSSLVGISSFVWTCVNFLSSLRVFLVFPKGPDTRSRTGMSYWLDASQPMLNHLISF